jgi:hypothetical protein
MTLGGWTHLLTGFLRSAVTLDLSYFSSGFVPQIFRFEFAVRKMIYLHVVLHSVLKNQFSNSKTRSILSTVMQAYLHQYGSLYSWIYRCQVKKD